MAEGLELIGPIKLNPDAAINEFEQMNRENPPLITEEIWRAQFATI